MTKVQRAAEIMAAELELQIQADEDRAYEERQMEKEIEKARKQHERAVEFRERRAPNRGPKNRD
jgi:hypothetical protein